MVRRAVVREKFLDLLKEIFSERFRDSDSVYATVYYNDLAYLLNISPTYAQMLLKVYCRAVGGRYSGGRCIVHREDFFNALRTLGKEGSGAEVEWGQG